MGIVIYLKPSEILFISKIFSIKNIGLNRIKKLKKTKGEKLWRKKKRFARFAKD